MDFRSRIEKAAWARHQAAFSATAGEGPVPLHSNLKVEPIWLTISDRLPPRRRGCVWLRGSLLRVRPMSAAVAFRSAAIDIAGWLSLPGYAASLRGAVLLSAARIFQLFRLVCGNVLRFIPKPFARRC
jgi:hypothetical protein